MSYNRKNYIRLKKQFEEQWQRPNRRPRPGARSCAAIPELKRMDDALSEIGLRMFRLAMELSGEELEGAIKSSNARPNNLLPMRSTD